MTERKLELLQIAQRLFKDKGYSAASMRDIAKAANVEPATLYSHVSGKEEFLDQTCFTMAKLFIDAIYEVNDIYFDAPQKLKMAVHNHVQILADNLDASVVFQHEWRHLSPERKQEFILLRNQYEEGFRTIVQDGVDAGLFNEVDKKIAALTILSSINWIVEWYNPDGKLSPKEIADQLHNFILTGLQKETLGLN
ncbi:MAG: AcrR family transcriptional regulator [Bacteroidia bacterium]|jgi:AcrR family transcriptional regulator